MAIEFVSFPIEHGDFQWLGKRLPLGTLGGHGQLCGFLSPRWGPPVMFGVLEPHFLTYSPIKLADPMMQRLLGYTTFQDFQGNPHWIWISLWQVNSLTLKIADFKRKLSFQSISAINSPEGSSENGLLVIICHLLNQADIEYNTCVHWLNDMANSYHLLNPLVNHLAISISKSPHMWTKPGNVTVCWWKRSFYL